MTALTLPPLAEIPRLIPGSVEWRTQPYVSASVAGALFGCHKFTDLPALAAMRRGESVDEAGEAAETGNEMEDFIAQRWAAKHGVTVYEPAVTYVCGPLSANPDRLIYGCQDTILQIKATTHEEAPLTPQHWWQEQAELACTGAQQAVVAYLFGGSMCFRDYTVGRDEGAIARLIEGAYQFLADLDLGIEPTPVALDPRTETLDVGKAEAEVLAELAALNASKAIIDKQAKTLRGEALAFLGAAGLPEGSRLSIVHDGKPICRLRVQRGQEKRTGTGCYGDPITVLESL